jgi:hypothetical protein
MLVQVLAEELDELGEIFATKTNAQMVIAVLEGSRWSQYGPGLGDDPLAESIFIQYLQHRGDRSLSG